MSKQTVTFLILFLVASFSLAITTGVGSVPFPKLLAQVGITVGVPANPENTLDAELSEEQTQLTQEQQDLAAREAAQASTTSASEAASPGTWYLAGAVIVIALLVLLNFYLDWRRARRAASAKPPESAIIEE